MENLNCHVIFQEKYGAGEPTDVMVDAILADAAKTSCKRVIAIGGRHGDRHRQGAGRL